MIVKYPVQKSEVSLSNRKKTTNLSSGSEMAFSTLTSSSSQVMFFIVIAINPEIEGACVTVIIQTLLSYRESEMENYTHIVQKGDQVPGNAANSHN